MWTQFILENAHFAINLFAALVFFSVFWLYYDAWKGNRKLKEGVCAVGFLILSVSFVLHSLALESSILEAPLIAQGTNSWLQLIMRIVGYTTILISIVTEKLQPRPNSSEGASAFLVIPFVVTPLVVLQCIPPVLAFLITLFYLRRAIIGLESHIKPVSIAFALFTITEVLSLGELFRTTQNVELYSFVAPFGPLWIAEHILLFIASILLARWVFGYLLKQFQTQLFIILSVLILSIFLSITIAFTYLLLRNIENETQTQLTSDVKVLEFALDSRREENRSNAQMIAENPDVREAIKEIDKAKLGDLAERFLLAKESSILVITDENGQILAQGEDREKVGGSLSNAVLIKRALLGESLGTVSSQEGVLSPNIMLAGSAPIFSDDKKTIIGAVMSGVSLDNAFVDGIKKATGLEASLYGDAILSATTLLTSDGKTRLTGIEEKNTQIRRTVLTDADVYAGETLLGDTSYVSSYLPLKDVDKNPVGMIFVGRPQSSVLQAAAKSIELTFIVAALLLVVSIVPSLLISRYLSKQL
jgi:hypothetical protein